MLTAPWIVEKLWKKHHDNLLMMKLFYPRWLAAYLNGESVEPQMKRACRRWLWTCSPRRFENGKWGWKNPNTLYFIPFWKSIYPNMIYINVIRDGRDIAFNRRMTYINHYNQGLFSTEERELPEHLRKALFWKRCNEIAQTNVLAADRRYTASFEDLCSNPTESIVRILNFLNSPLDENKIQEAAKLVKTPESLGRWKNEKKSSILEVEEFLGTALTEQGYQPSH